MPDDREDLQDAPEAASDGADGRETAEPTNTVNGAGATAVPDSTTPAYDQGADDQGADEARQDGEGAGERVADDDATEVGDKEADGAIAQLEAELAEAREQVLRAHAEAQNAQRRAQQEVEKARKFALERFCSELLPVVDNLERALESASADDEHIKPIAEGVELTLKSFLGALARFNIEPVEPHGEPFDPQFHQAMSAVPNADVEPNTVVAVMQKGYTLNGRLVRPAMVMVSKAAD